MCVLFCILISTCVLITERFDIVERANLVLSHYIYNMCVCAFHRNEPNNNNNKKKEKTERTKKEILIYLKNINIKILKQLEKNNCMKVCPNYI